MIELLFTGCDTRILRSTRFPETIVRVQDHCYSGSDTGILGTKTIPDCQIRHCQNPRSLQTEKG